MKEKPIQIPADIAAKCDEPGQFERFDKVFSKLAANTDHPNPEPQKPRGRPRKAK